NGRPSEAPGRGVAPAIRPTGVGSGGAPISPAYDLDPGIRPESNTCRGGMARSTVRPILPDEGRTMRRRHFLMTTGLATGAAAGAQPAPPAPGRPGIRITDIKAFLVGLGRNHIFVKVETDQGIHGIGEAYSCGPDQATLAVIADFKEWLAGRDP